jgi:cytochrome P450
MDMLNIHGPTVTGTEGEESRRYRRITAGSFSTKTYEQTWRETLIQAEALFQRLETLQDKRKLNSELERMTLNIVSNVCCGTGEGRDAASSKAPTQRPSHMHELTYQEAFGKSTEYMPYLYLIPHFVLSRAASVAP